MKRNARNFAAGLVAFGAVVAAAPARAEGGYVGVDLVALVNKLTYSIGGSSYDETYSGGHLRLKGGYRFTDMFAIEGQLLSGSSDTQNDPFGNPYKMTTGPIAGLYGRLDIPLGETAGLYGLLGVASTSTEYQTQVGGAPIDKNKGASLSFGFGLQVRFTEHVAGTIDLMWYKIGTASYPSYFSGNPDQVVGGFGAGLTYSF